MSLIKAREVRKNQEIVLDMGYGAHSMDERCVVVSVKCATNLFGIPVYQFRVRRPGGELIDVIDHLPEDRLEAA